MNELSLCIRCWCMTYTTADGKCAKCGEKKYKDWDKQLREEEGGKNDSK